MKKLVLVFILISAAPGLLRAGNDNYPMGGRAAGMGFAGVTLTDLWSVQLNQAGLAGLKHAVAGTYYENKFLVSELSLKSVAVALPVRNSGVFGFSADHFGYSAYNEQKIGIGYGRGFGENFRVGVQLDYLSTTIGDGYGTNKAFAAEIGVQADLVAGLTVGAHIYNPTRVKMSDFNNEKIPTILKVGLGYKFSDKVNVAIETEKDAEADADFKAGLEYNIVEQFAFRAGISTQPVVSYFGFGVLLGNVRIDLATGLHSELGVTPHVSLQYEFK